MIFISYRRADSESVVGRIYSELKKHFPTQDVFLDHDSIPLGKPFLDVIRERLATSKFALVLIGPQWCSIKDEKTGQRRLDDPNDFVRQEVETALATPGVDVIPLWVMRANTPSEEIATLPASLQPLFKNHGMSIEPVPREDQDLHRLIARLSKQADGASADHAMLGTLKISLHADCGGTNDVHLVRHEWIEKVADALSENGYRRNSFQGYGYGSPATMTGQKAPSSILRVWKLPEAVVSQITKLVTDALQPLAIKLKVREFTEIPRGEDGSPSAWIEFGQDFCAAVDQRTTPSAHQESPTEMGDRHDISSDKSALRILIGIEANTRRLSDRTDLAKWDIADALEKSLLEDGFDVVEINHHHNANKVTEILHRHTHHDIVKRVAELTQEILGPFGIKVRVRGMGRRTDHDPLIAIDLNSDLNEQIDKFSDDSSSEPDGSSSINDELSKFQHQFDEATFETAFDLLLDAEDLISGIAGEERYKSFHVAWAQIQLHHIAALRAEETGDCNQATISRSQANQLLDQLKRRILGIRNRGQRES